MQIIFNETSCLSVERFDLETFVVFYYFYNTYFIFFLFSRPDDQVVSEISHLLYKENVSSDILLSITSLIHTYCKQNVNYKDNVKLMEDVMYMEQKIKENILKKGNRDEVGITYVNKISV